MLIHPAPWLYSRSQAETLLKWLQNSAQLILLRLGEYSELPKKGVSEGGLSGNSGNSA